MKVSWQFENVVKGIIAIFADEELWRRGHRSIIGSKPVLPITCQDEAELQSIYASLEYAGAKKYAYYRLAAKNHATFELQKLFDTKFVSATTSERILAELQQLGYINDGEWVESFIRTQLRKRVGPQLIKAKLRQKGVPNALYEDKFVDGESQSLAIEKLIKTRYRTRNLSDFKERQKVIAALMRRGFDLDEILEVFNKGLR